MGTTARRERERQEMREAILQAAMQLFLDESFEKTTMRRIAEAIEYTPGALYSYFKDKDEILYALHQRGFDTLFEMQRDAAGIEDPVDRLKRLAEIYIGFALAHPHYYDLMFINSATARSIERDETWECGLRAYDVLRDTIREVIAAGRMRGTSDPEVAAFAAWAGVHGIASLIIRGRCGVIPEEERERVVRSAMALLMELTRPASEAGTDRGRDD